jgi:hypothetical protein
LRRLILARNSSDLRPHVTGTDVSYLTLPPGKLDYAGDMFTKTSETGSPMFDLKDDLRIDHALIVIGVAAALIALIYLLVT